MKKGALFTSIGSVIILIICFIAFVLPSSLGRGQKEQNGIEFGKFDKKPITYSYQSDFSNFVSYYAEMYRNQGYQIDSSMQYYIFNYAFNSTVVKYAYSHEVKKSGYQVPQEAINRQIRPNFYDENGKFSTKLFNSADASQIQKLQADIKAELYNQRFSDDINGSNEEFIGDSYTLYGLKNSKAEINFLKAYNDNKRAFKMVAFKKADFPEEEKLNFAKNNSAKFNQFDLSVITVKDEAEAKKIVSRLDKEEITFEDAVAEYSDKNYTNSEGKLNNSFQYQLENILDDKADVNTLTNLSEGSRSDIIKTTYGYSIFRSNGAVTAPDFDLDSVKSRVSSYITSYESSLVEDYFINKANNFISQANYTGFDIACEDCDLENLDVPAFPLNYSNSQIADTLNTSITGLSGAATNENFLKTAFTLKADEISKPVVLDDYVVVLQYVEEPAIEDDTDNNEELAEADEDERTQFDTSNEDDNDDYASSAYGIPADIGTFDNNSLQEFIMSSPLLENHFSDAYYSNMM